MPTLNLDALHLAHGGHDDPEQGLCRCGCGQPAPIAQRTNARLGHTKGQPLTYLPGHNKRGTTDLSRYQIRVDGCWEWTGSRSRKGYGRAQVNGEHTGAHRAIYEARYGRLAEDQHLDHLCHRPWCVNPDHLRVVTAVVNNRAKSTTKVDDATAVAIRSEQGSHSEVARRYGVSRQYVADIRSGRRHSMISPAVA